MVATLQKPVAFLLLLVYTASYSFNKPVILHEWSRLTRIYSTLQTKTLKPSKLIPIIKLDEKSSLMLDALRGKNLNDADKQVDGVDMKVVEFRNSEDVNDVLPLTYDIDKLESYFKRRPASVITRVWQILSASTGFISGILTDYITGNIEDIEVRRAAELRNTIVSLGPFFIKLGQALSIRPDILSPRAMVELQQLCDKVPCFDSKLAMQTIKEELGESPANIFSKMTPEPVAAASLGQVYRATIAATGEEVAVKVQRPFVLETVSLDLYLVRQIGLFLRNFPEFSNRLDIVSLLDEFAGNFYQELDYNLECQNGIKIAEDMKKLPMVVIPKNYPRYTARRVHTAEWIEGEKLSQSKENDVGALVNLGVITYLTQLLDTGFFHADPHPGNMLRTPDGKLVILDFGLMTKITDEQKYSMIEAIAHLIHRDYDEIGNDFINLDFIPKGTDTKPIIPALARVFEAALAGGGAKSLNFQELAADLAEITFKFPFRIPPYFALIIRAISVLEGIALVGNPEFAIVDEAYPYISRRLMTDDSPRLKAAFRYMIYGKSGIFDIDRMIDMLQALEKFVAVKDSGDGSAFKVDGKRGNVFVGKAGDSKGTQPLAVSSSLSSPGLMNEPMNEPNTNNAILREAVKFFFSDDGILLRESVLDEISRGIDVISRDAAREIVMRLGIPTRRIPKIIRAMTPKLNKEDEKVVESTLKLIGFFLGNNINIDLEHTNKLSSNDNNDKQRISVLKSFQLLANNNNNNNGITPAYALDFISNNENQEKLRSILPILREYSPNMRSFGLQIVKKLFEKSTERFLQYSSDAIFGPTIPSQTKIIINMK
eukprot:gene9147-12337_t